MISVISSNFVDFGYLNALKSMFTAFITSFRIDLPMGMDYYDETGRMSSQIFDCIKMSFPINKAPEVERIFHNVDRTLRKAPRCNSVERFVYISEQIPRGTLSTLVYLTMTPFIKPINIIRRIMDNQIQLGCVFKSSIR